MRIGDLSRQTGLSSRMLRYYEQEGLLHPTRGATATASTQRMTSIARSGFATWSHPVYRLV